MKRVWLSTAAILLAVSTHASAKEVRPLAPRTGEAYKLLDATIAGLAESDPSVPGIVAAVSAPRLGIEWQGAVGSLERGKPEPLRATDSFRMASITKVFVSATVMKLIEADKFGLFDPISPLLSENTKDELRSGGYDLNALTVYHLLTHTSGIYDISSSDEYIGAMAKDPQHHWTREEQIAFAMKVGKPTAKPGTEYHYSDTSYVILGEIIERASGKQMGTAIAETLQFKRLGLKATYLEKFQPVPQGERRLHQYYGNQDFTDADASFDLYGGGGLVSNVGDLVRFIRPLLRGELFTDRSTMAMSLMSPPTQNGKLAHAPLLGLFKFGKRYCWWHAGFWGQYVVYCPDNDVAVALSFGQGLPAKMTFPNMLDKMAAAIETIEASKRSVGEHKGAD